MIHLPGLEIFDATQHVQMTSRVLLDHIHDVIWSQALFELPLGYQKLHNAERGKNNLYATKEISENNNITTTYPLNGPIATVIGLQ